MHTTTHIYTRAWSLHVGTPYPFVPHAVKNTYAECMKHYKEYLGNYTYEYKDSPYNLGDIRQYDPIALMMSNHFSSVFPHSVSVEKYILYHGLGDLESPMYLTEKIFNPARLLHFEKSRHKKSEFQSQHRIYKNNQQLNYLSWLTPKWSCQKELAKAPKFSEMENKFRSFLKEFNFKAYNLEWIDGARNEYAVDKTMKNKISPTSLANGMKVEKEFCLMLSLTSYFKHQKNHSRGAYSTIWYLQLRGIAILDRAR